MRFSLFFFVGFLFFVSCALSMDWEGPKLTVQYPVQNAVFPVGEIYLSGTAQDEISGVRNVYNYFQGKTNRMVYLDGAWSGSLSVNNPGNYQVKIWATDRLNNVSEVIQRDFRVSNRVYQEPDPLLSLEDDVFSNAVFLELSNKITNALKIGQDSRDWFLFDLSGANIFFVERIGETTNAFWISLYTNPSSDPFETRYFSLSDEIETWNSTNLSSVYCLIYSPLLSNEVYFRLSLE